MGVLQIFLDKNVYITGDFINGKLEFIKGRHVSIEYFDSTLHSNFPLSGVYMDLIITEIAQDSLSDNYHTKTNVLHKTRVTLAGATTLKKPAYFQEEKVPKVSPSIQEHILGHSKSKSQTDYQGTKNPLKTQHIKLDLSSPRQSKSFIRT
jgi:hypothetical protein